jgi:hypothetical protein
MSPPSESSLDSDLGVIIVSNRSASVAGPGPSAFLPRAVSRPTGGVYRSPSPPPLTKRSVSFVRDLADVGTRFVSQRGGSTGTSRCSTSWTYKRQCMSVGDSIDERVESANPGGADYLSVRSLAPVAAPKLEPCAGGSDLVAMVAGASTASGALPVGGYHQASSSLVGTSESLSSRSTSGNLGPPTTTCVSHDDLRNCPPCYDGLRNCPPSSHGGSHLEGGHIGSADCVDVIFA